MTAAAQKPDISLSVSNILSFNRKFNGQFYLAYRMEIHGIFNQKNTPANCSPEYLALAHQDSNLEMTESESVALPFGDGPLCLNVLYYISPETILQAFFKKFLQGQASPLVTDRSPTKTQFHHRSPRNPTAPPG